MTPILLLLIPVLALIVLANLGQNSRTAARLTDAALLSLALLALLAGLGILLLPAAARASFLAPVAAADLRSSGLWLILTGLASAMVFVAALIHRRRQGAHSRRWSDPAPLTALILALLFAGTNLAQASLLTSEVLSELEFDIGPGMVAGQNLLFVLAACLGVGWGTRRTLTQVARRLGVTGLSFARVGRAVAVTFFLLGMSAIMGGFLTLFAPDAAASAESINQAVVGAFKGMGGAVLLGLLTGIGEETLYRGALQPAFGLGLTSLIFALHHIQYLSPALILIFCLGLVLGWVRNRWGLTTAALVHAFYNTSLILLAMAAADLVQRS